MRKLTKRILPFLTVVSLFALASCGFVGEEPLASKELYTSNQIAACDINGEAFARIMEEDIDQAILCLETSFTDFSANVESENKELLNKGQISLFIEKFMDNQKDSILNALDLLFKVNMLILKDHPDYISKQNFKNITRLLLITNRSAVQFKNIYDSLDRETASRQLIALKRQEMKKTIEYFSQGIVGVITSAMGSSQQINLHDLIADLKNLFEDDRENNINLDQIDDLLSLKTILVGGSQDILTTDEVIQLLKNLPTLAMVVYDAYYAREAHFEDQRLGLYRYYGDLINDFIKIFNFRDSKEVLFTKTDAMKIADFIADYDEEDEIDQNKARGMVDAFFVLKKHAISPELENIVVADIDKLAFYAKLVLESVASVSEIQDTLDQEVAHQEKKAQFLSLTTDAQAHLLSIFKERKVKIGEINLTKLVNDLRKVISKYNLDIDVDQIDNLLPLKQFFIGGERNLLTDKDFEKFLTSLDTIALSAFDFFYSKKTDFANGQQGLFHLFSDTLHRLQSLFANRKASENLLTIEDAYRIADFVAQQDEDDDLDEEQARAIVDIFFSFKREVIGQSAALIVDDINPLFLYGRMVMEAAGHLTTIADLMTDDSDEVETLAEKQLKRAKIEKILLQGQEQIKTLFNSKTFTFRSFDVLSLVDAIANSFETADLFDLDFDLVRKLVPIKKVFLGGSRTDFTEEQIKILIEKFPKLALVIYDLSQYKGEDYSSDEAKMGFFIDLARSGKSLIHKFANEEKELIYTIDELVATIDLATDNEYNVSKFSDSIETVIVKFLKGAPKRFTIKDIRTLLNYAEELTESIYYNSLAYDFNGSVMAKKSPLKAQEVNRLPQNKQTRLSPTRLDELHKEFAILTEKLHLYRTDDGKQFYGHDIIRTKYGINEAGIARFGVKKLLEAYCPAPNTNPLTCGVDAKILNKFLTDFKSLLVEINLWSSNMQSFASNVLYLADLFQTRSDGNQLIGLDEGVEYVGLILSAVKIAGEVKDGLVARCGNYTQGTVEEQEENPTIELNCFRKNVINVWLNELDYKQYLSAFNNYANSVTPQLMQEYIRYLEKFVHENQDEPFMRVRDITLFIGAILNVESMLIRFDGNRNNFLDPNEVEQAFLVYENLIVDLGGLSGSKKKYAKSAFLFMVKEMKFPSTSDVLTYHYNPFASKKVEAHRINVASILYYFSTL